jgi:hypothetical protein
MFAATWFTAIATGILAIFAVVTAWNARKAFREQSEEVRTIKAQLTDQEDLNAKQTPVLELQVKEFQESIEERKRTREENERRQVTQVAAWMIVERQRDGERAEVDASDPSLDALDPSYDPRGVHFDVIVQNASDQPSGTLRLIYRASLLKGD